MDGLGEEATATRMAKIHHRGSRSGRRGCRDRGRTRCGRQGDQCLTCELKSFDFSGAKLRQVAPGVAILSYTATQDTTCEGAKLPPKLQVTSVYVQKDGKWLSANYQETPID